MQSSKGEGKSMALPNCQVCESQWLDHQDIASGAILALFFFFGWVGMIKSGLIELKVMQLKGI